MEIEKVLRIVTIFIAIAALAIFVARRTMFPDASLTEFLPIVICVVICFSQIWKDAAKKKNEQTKE